MRHARVYAFGFAALAGCVTSHVTGPNIPDGSIVYKIAPLTIQYHYVDVRAVNGGDYELFWLPLAGFTGVNCLGLLPHSAVDTNGTFVFAWAGPNTGSIQRRIGTTIDTVEGKFRTSAPRGPEQGTHGTFAVDATGRLTLLWADGTPSEYFDPSAVIRLSGDTISSSFSVHLFADSLQYSWQVSWIRDTSC